MQNPVTRLLQVFQSPVELPRTLLPVVPSQTITWYSRTAKNFKWDVAQGIRQNLEGAGAYPTNELNLTLIFDRTKGNLAEATSYLVNGWVGLQILLETRAFLVDRGVREDVDFEGERSLVTAMNNVVAGSPKTRRYYINRGIRNILRGDWDLDEEVPNNYPKLLKLLQAWLDAGSDLIDLQDGLYLQNVLEGLELNGQK